MDLTHPETCNAGTRQDACPSSHPLLSASVRTCPRTLALAQARGSYVKLDALHLLHLLHPVLCCRCMIAGAVE